MMPEDMEYTIIDEKSRENVSAYDIFTTNFNEGLKELLESSDLFQSSEKKKITFEKLPEMLSNDYYESMGLDKNKKDVLFDIFISAMFIANKEIGNKMPERYIYSYINGEISKDDFKHQLTLLDTIKILRDSGITGGYKRRKTIRRKTIRRRKSKTVRRRKTKTARRKTRR
jgi:hypothetical protein